MKTFIQILSIMFLSVGIFSQTRDSFSLSLVLPQNLPSNSAIYYTSNAILCLFKKRRKNYVVIYSGSGEKLLYQKIAGRNVNNWLYPIYNARNLFSFKVFRQEVFLFSLDRLGVFNWKTQNVFLLNTSLQNNYIIWSTYHREPFLRTGEWVVLFWEGDYSYIKTGKDIVGKHSLAILDHNGNIVTRFGKYPSTIDETYIWGTIYFSYAVDTSEINDVVCVQYGPDARLYLYKAPNWEEKQQKILMPPGYRFVGVDKDNYYFTGADLLFAYDKKTLKRNKQWSLELAKTYKKKGSRWYSNGFHFEKNKRYLQFYKYTFYDKNKLKLEVHTIEFK